MRKDTFTAIMETLPFDINRLRKSDKKVELVVMLNDGDEYILNEYTNDLRIREIHHYGRDLNITFENGMVKSISEYTSQYFDVKDIKRLYTRVTPNDASNNPFSIGDE